MPCGFDLVVIGSSMTAAMVAMRYLHLKKRYFTSAAAANKRTTMTINQNRPTPHIIDPMWLVMAFAFVV